MTPPERLASAADVAAALVGPRRIQLRWTHPEDVVTHGMHFDVYGSPDPLQPFRQLRAGDVAATACTVDVPDVTGDLYLTVVAVRGELVALPSPVLHVVVPADAEPVPLTPAAPVLQGPVGPAFPFRLTAGGSVATDQGDALLRGMVLQLLLTGPGERVNVPDYGTRLRDLVFDPTDDVLAAATEFTVSQALRRYLGDLLAVERVQVSVDGGELLVDVVYRRMADLETERLRVGVPIPT